MHSVSATHYAAEGVGILFFASVVALRKVEKNQKKYFGFFNKNQFVYLFLFCLLIFHGRSEVYNFRTYINLLPRYHLVQKALQVIPKK